MLRTIFQRSLVEVPRRYRLWMTILLCVFSLLYLVAWGADQSLLWPELSLLSMIVAFLCWRGSNLGFALAIFLSSLGLIADVLFLVLDVWGFFSPNIVIPALVVYALLQFPLAYAGLHAYGGRLRWPALLVLIASLLLASSYIQNASSSYLAPAIDISKPQLTTLSEILASRFPSALDKYGTNGTVVEVVNVTVIQLAGALDGDWHVVVSQGQVSPFITEILPRDQGRLGIPTVGSKIAMIGVVYWDNAHVKEAWHGYTGWEIHPVLAWSAIS